MELKDEYSVMLKFELIVTTKVYSKDEEHAIEEARDMLDSELELEGIPKGFEYYYHAIKPVRCDYTGKAKY